MKIAVIGTGGIGGYFGAQLVIAGHSVTFVSRGETLKTLTESGLNLKTESGSYVINRDQYRVISSDPTSIEDPNDLVIICVKTYSNESILETVSPFIGSQTSVMTLQNGLNPCEAFNGISSEINLVQGIAYVETAQDSPGHYVQQGDVTKIIYGTRSKVVQEPEWFSSIFEGSAVLFEKTEDLDTESWSKFAFISTVAGVTAACKMRLRDLFEEDKWIQNTKYVLDEIGQIANSSGVDGDKIVAEGWSFIMDNYHDITASMHTDVMLGKALEIDALTGTVCILAERRQIPVPLNDLIYRVLAPYKHGSAIQ